jgi:hypothetical protein
MNNKVSCQNLQKVIDLEPYLQPKIKKKRLMISEMRFFLALRGTDSYRYEPLFPEQIP